MNVILNDESKFTKLGPVETYDKTASHEKKFCKGLNKMVKDNLLPKSVADEIRPVGSQRPRLYGLPKIHKDGTPLRPVLSAIGSPQYPVAKYLAKILGKDNRNDYIVVTNTELTLAKRSFTFRGAELWNCLPNSIRNQTNIGGFKKMLRIWVKENIPRFC